MTISTKLYTWLFCRKVGEDQFGNQYYISKHKDSFNRNKRSVIYKGITEPTKVPPMWHAWINYMTDDLPESIIEYQWQKTYYPNLTGTDKAVYPEGFKLSEKAQRAKVSADYQPWNKSNE